MIKDSPGYNRCRFCNSSFSDDLLKKIQVDKIMFEAENKEDPSELNSDELENSIFDLKTCLKRIKSKYSNNIFESRNFNLFRNN